MSAHVCGSELCGCRIVRTNITGRHSMESAQAPLAARRLGERGAERVIALEQIRALIAADCELLVSEMLAEGWSIPVAGDAVYQWWKQVVVAAFTSGHDRAVLAAREAA